MGVLNSLAPQARPRLWGYVHCFVFLYSLTLLVINSFCTDDSKGVKFAKASYLYYSLVTTFIWAAFVGLDLAHDHWEAHTWEKKIELIVAVIFTATSLDELLEWKLKQQNIFYMEADILGNTLVYGYEAKKFFLPLLGLKEGYEALPVRDDDVPVATQVQYQASRA